MVGFEEEAKAAQHKVKSLILVRIWGSKMGKEGSGSRDRIRDLMETLAWAGGGE